MASAFLKRMAQQQAEKITREQGEDAYGGVKWLNQQLGNGGEGGTAPPSAGNQNVTQQNQPSAFLSRMAQQQAEKITREQGEDAYGGLKWLQSRGSAQSVKTVSFTDLADQAERELETYKASDVYRQKRENYMQDAASRGISPYEFIGLAFNYVDQTEQELKTKAAYYRTQAQQEADNALMQRDMDEFNTWDPVDQAALMQYVAENNAEPFIGEPTFQNARYNAQGLIDKYGAQKVKEMAESYRRSKNQEISETAGAMAQEAADSTGGAILHSALSVGANAANALTSPVGYLQELSGRTGRYSTLDPNNAGNLFSQYAGNVRQKVAENISGDKYDEEGNLVKDGGLFRQGLSTLYEAGMSAADSLARIFFAGGNQGPSLGLAATGSFGQTVSDASSQGIDPVRAVAMGIVDGGLEVLTERVSLDNLFKQAAAGPKGLKEVMKGIFKAGAIEVSEEELSFLGSTFAEAAILQEKSGYNQQVGQLMAQGKTYATAREEANKSLLMEAVETGVQSFLSGGMMGGGAAVVNARRTSKIGKTFGEMGFDKADIQDLIDSGLESDPDTESHQIALKLDQEIAAGKTPSNYDLARLWQANEQAIREEQEESAVSVREGQEAAQPAVADVTENAPAVPAEAQSVIANGQNVTQNTPNVTQAARNVTVEPVGVAAQLRQNQGINGGNLNDEQQGRIAGPAAAQVTGTAADTGTGVLSGGGQRFDGTGTGEQTGGMAGRAGPAAQSQALIDQRRATVDRQNRVRSLRLPKISSAELGLPSGTESRNIQLVPQEYYDTEMEQLSQRIYQETGKTVSFVMGRLQIRGADRSIRNVNGVVYGDRIVVRADHLRLSMEQIADHEAYHAKVDWAKESGADLNAEIRRHIVETFSEEEFRAVLAKYVEALRGVYDVGEVQSGEDYQQLMNQIQEEVFADAYAGINAFGAGSDRFTSAVNERMEQLGTGRLRNQENGVRETNGPPGGERFSYAEETADSQTFGSAEDAYLTDEEYQKRYGLKLPTLEEDNTSGGTERYSVDATDPTLEGKYIKGDITAETVEADIRKVAQMEPVAQITGGEFDKGEKDLITQVTEFFDALDNRAYNPQLGSITLDRQGVRSDIAHGIGRKKAAAFAAVPDVLARGYVVDYQKNWKGRGYDTAVVAAPVKIGEEEYLMGIVLNRNPPENKFYVHEVLTTENGASPFKTGTRKGYPSGNTPSVLSILDKIRGVKNGTGYWERFSVDSTVEETADLLAIHNLKENDLEWALNMGGLPMPSIAIVKADQGHSNFGDVSIVFRKSTIDPAVRENKVFGSDAWTPTAPQVDYPVDYQIMTRMEDEIAELSSRIAGGIFSRGSVLSGIISYGQTSDSPQELADRLSRNDAVKAAYLAATGGTLDPTIREVKKQYDSFGNDALRRFINNQDEYEMVDRFYDRMEAGVNQFEATAEEVEMVRQALREYWQETRIGLKPESLEKRLQKLSDERAAAFIRNAWQMYIHGDSTGETEVDTGATENKLHQVASDSDVKAWILPRLNDMIGEAGLYNGKDPFTKSGNRKSFAQLHDPVTLENIVHAMKRQSTRGEGIMYVDAKSMVAMATPEYKSISQVKADSGRLKTLEAPDYNAHIQELDDMIDEFKLDVAGRSYMAQESVGYALMEAAGKSDTVITRVFREYGFSITPEQLMKTKKIYSTARNMPTEYFEAKPERVVRPEEWALVAVPSDMTSELKQKAADAGARVVEYERGNAESRARAVNTDSGLRFSVDDTDMPQSQEQKPKRRSIKPVAESRPIIAKKDLRNTMMNLFSIPDGSRAKLGDMIDSYADRLIKNGALTEEDRKHFFDRMYDAGVMTMPADDYFSEGRNLLKGGRVYVPDSVRADFGDDWGDIRRRAFGAGIYFTSDRSAGGIDMWNSELAEQLPGLFDAEETDLRSILERIVEVAEEGKDEKLSLAEYTARLAEQDFISEREFLDNMERQMDWALRTFAEKARLEVHLRDRTGARIAREREEHREMQQRQKDRKELRELQQKTLKTLQWLNKNRNRAPEELKAAFDEVLGDIDLYAVGAADEMRWSDKYNATWKDLAQMFKDAMKNDPNFLPSKELERIVARLDGSKIADMDLGALNDLYKAAIGLRTEFYNRNNVISDEMNRLFAEVYTDAKKEIEAAPGSYTGKGIDKLMNLDQLTPMNVLQRMGGWDPDGAFYSMAKQLEKGERDMRAYSVKAQRMLQEFLTEHEDWVKKADGQGKDGIWYEIEIPELIALELGKKPKFGDSITVQMTPAQKVHMYLESKNVDNLRHMTGGRTFADKKLYSEGKRQEALAQGKTVRMAPETVKAIVSDLTAKEMELARLLEQYYNSFATQEINRISNILYGYDKAMGKNYAPIYTNRNYTKTEFGVFDQTAEGVGNLKGRQYAVNPSYNISAFDAFEKHVDQTARFVGMAIPARNWTTLMNWREKNNSTGDVITHKWGEEAKRYITDLINTLQAGDDVKSDTVSSTVSKLQSTYITAIFGANPSIVLKQLGSIPLASAYLDAKNLPTAQQIKDIDRELIGKYTQDLEWRTMGYSTPETKQLKENPNWTQTNKFYQFTFGGGAITAMDGWAASVLWPWAENKVRRDFPDLEVGTQAQIDNGESPFYRKVAELFEDALSRSQSTSDEIHQSSLRKSKNPITKAFTMFRSDSAQTYNTLRQKIGEAQYYSRTGAKAKVQEKAKKAVGAAFISLLMNSMWSEAINFLMALWKNKGKNYRDEEDELTFQSVAGEMASGMVGSFGGIVTGGEEMLEIIGNLLTGEKIYDIETPGIEQLNDLVTAVTGAGANFREIIAGAVDVAANGGNVGDYFGKHSGEILGSIKELAEAVVMYLPGLPMSGLPVSNLEAYLLGAVKWLSPELGAAYDDLFSDVSKNDLSGLEGDVLASRVNSILQDRNVSEAEGTAQILAGLYEAGYKTAIPSDTPSGFSIDGEQKTLSTYQQQAYDTTWSGIVAGALDELVASDFFTEAGQDIQAKMLNYLYTYAAEITKSELYEGYEPDTRDEGVSEFAKVDLSLVDFLCAYGKYSEINSMDMDSGRKATTFAHWVNAQGYTEEQAAVVKDELAYFNMAPASSSGYDEFVEAGMSPDDAYDLTAALDELEPTEGETEVSDIQKWRTCIQFSSNVAIQMAALRGEMDDNRFAKLKMAYDFDVDPDTYVTYYETRSKYDADGNGSYTQAEVTSAIDSISGLSKAQKAALWQIVTGAKSAKNNPYSREIGQRVLDAKGSQG